MYIGEGKKVTLSQTTPFCSSEQALLACETNTLDHQNAYFHILEKAVILKRESSRAINSYVQLLHVWQVSSLIHKTRCKRQEHGWQSLLGRDGLLEEELGP